MTHVTRPTVDLHMHSTASDGRLAPAAVMRAAAEAGLRVVALTDHDTLDGLAEAERQARELDLRLVPGIEVAAYDEAGSTHLLGYFVDRTAQEFASFLAMARDRRLERAGEIVERLNELGLGVSLEDVVAQAEGGLIARPHIARALVAGGWVKSYRLAFDRFIAAGRPAYVPTRFTTPKEAIGLIHGADGLAVLAHPGSTHDRERILDLVHLQLDGLEVLHPDHGPEEVRRLGVLADELDLLKTGGSDWHGPHNGNRGTLASQPVPYEWYEELLEARGLREGRIEG